MLAVAFDEVGVDRSREARTVELDADELAPAALSGARPARADLDLADEDAEVPLRLAALFDRRDRDLGLEAVVWMVPVKPALAFVKVPMVGMI